MNAPVTPIEVIKDQQSYFMSALKTDAVKWEQEMQFAIQALQGNNYLYEAAMNNPAALQNAIINVAAVGISLNPALKYAYLVPRSPARNKPPQVYLDMSYRGLLHIGTSSGSIEWGQSKLVYEHDHYENIGVDKAPLHQSNTFGDKGRIVGAYCTVKTPGGDFLTEEMDMATITKIRSTSKAQNGPWQTWFEEMARKSVVKRASKYWPNSERIAQAVHVLNEHEGLVDDQAVISAEFSSTLSTEQLDQLRNAMNMAGVDEQYMLTTANVESLDQIKAARFQPAMKHLQKLTEGGQNASH